MKHQESRRPDKRRKSISNETSQGRQLNRRVEIKSVGYYESKAQLKLEEVKKN